MHKYTELRVEELSTLYNKKRAEEWNKLSTSMPQKGLSHSSAHIDSFLDIGYKYIDTLIDNLMDTEKNALLHEQITHNTQYFNTLKSGITKMVKDELNAIHSESVKRFQKFGGSTLGIVLQKIENQANSYQQPINRKVELLQEELKLRISKPSSGTTIHISEEVAVINTEEVYSSIQVKLEALKDSNQMILIEAFKGLANAINDSKIDDEIKREQMENIEFLVSQCEILPEKRNRGVIKATEKFLSTATNLTTIWRQVEPVITDVLNKGFYEKSKGSKK
jgi:hypothetical protein